jgi:hypothetical protein
MFDLVDRGLAAGFGVNVEPTDLRVAIAQKGCDSLRVTTEGVAAGGADPGLGRNAIYEMAKGLITIEEAPLPVTILPGVAYAWHRRVGVDDRPDMRSVLGSRWGSFALNGVSTRSPAQQFIGPIDECLGSVDV